MRSSRKLRSNSCHVNYEKQANCGGVFRQAISKLSKGESSILNSFEEKNLEVHKAYFSRKITGA